jgi:hypothetical protein
METVRKLSVRTPDDYADQPNRLISLERDTGLEPATFALARRRSTN